MTAPGAHIHDSTHSLSSPEPETDLNNPHKTGPHIDSITVTMGRFDSKPPWMYFFPIRTNQINIPRALPPLRAMCDAHSDINGEQRRMVQGRIPDRDNKYLVSWTNEDAINLFFFIWKWPLKSVFTPKHQYVTVRLFVTTFCNYSKKNKSMVMTISSLGLGIFSTLHFS